MKPAAFIVWICLVGLACLVYQGYRKAQELGPLPRNDLGVEIEEPGWLCMWTENNQCTTSI